MRWCECADRVVAPHADTVASRGSGLVSQSNFEALGMLPELIQAVQEMGWTSVEQAHTVGYSTRPPCAMASSADRWVPAAEPR
jgi:hypothetical protein